jgi:hypothetical protein
LVRRELAGKLTILGYFGMCPNVNVGVARLDQPTVLTFLIIGDSGEGQFSTTVSVIDERDQRVVATAPDISIVAEPDSGTSLAPALMIVFGRPGQYTIRVHLDGNERYRGAFRVSQGA